MISIPLYFLLFVYALFLLGFGVFFLVNIGHLATTGTLTIGSFVVTLAFLAFAALTLWSTWNLLSVVDWQTPITVWDAGWIGNFTGNNSIYKGL